LGTIATGTWEATDIGISHGGTGQSTQQAAIDALTNVSGATNEHVLTKDTATGNAIFKVASGGTDEKVKIDSGATAGYIGAASNDGVLRTGAGLAYADGGDFVTLTVDVGIADDKIMQVDDADAADDDYAKFTANGLEGRSSAEVLGDLSSSATSAFDLNGQDLTNGGVLFLTEQASAESDVAGKGQFWVKTVTPNEAWFTNDAGTDYPLSGYVSRGDASGWDKDQTTFTMDNAWHDWDIGPNGAAIVPAGAKMVHIRNVIKDGTVGAYMQLQKNGYTQGYNAMTHRIFAANMYQDMTDFVEVDSDGVIEYKLSETFTEAYVLIKGWVM
jgi:hypothetical protein